MAVAGSVNAQDTACERLVDRMTGSFSGAQQAATVSSYYNITLHMVRIWTDRDEGYWYYVEQAASATRGKPYRQGVYRVSLVETGFFKSEVFSIPDPEKHVGEGGSRSHSLPAPCWRSSHNHLSSG